MTVQLERFTQYRLNSGNIDCRVVFVEQDKETHKFFCRADELLSRPDLVGRFAVIYSKKADFLTDGEAISFIQIPMFRVVQSRTNEDRLYWYLYHSLPEEAGI